MYVVLYHFERSFMIKNYLKPNNIHYNTRCRIPLELKRLNLFYKLRID